MADLPIGGPVDSPGGSTDDPASAHQATVQAFLRRSRDRWKTADAASSAVRAKMRYDQRFAAGGEAQWDAVDATTRKEEGRPCLTINRIPQFIRQVSNQSRANRSQIQVNPRGQAASVKTAAAIQGLMRSVEIDSDADVAYDTAVEHQLRIGLGYVRLRAVYDAEDSFDQTCRLERVRNPLSVYVDPSCQEFGLRDMRHLHLIAVLGKDEYEARWGEVSSYLSLTEYLKTDSAAADWMPEGKVVLAEYFYVQVEQKTLLQLADGTTLFEPQLGAFAQAFADAYPGQTPPAVTRDRLVDTRVVYWCLHNAIEILEGNADKTAGRVVPGTRIPVFPVIGDEVDLDGTVDYRGMVRDAIGPAQMYNFWSSSVAETIALAPKAPWIAAAGQVAAYLDDWRVANRKPLSVLTYDPKTVDGQIVPPPERSVANPPIEALVTGLREADQDLKAVMGLFEASLGEKGPQQSGKAITAVQQQGQLANSNYLDNLQRTKREVGRSLLEWFPAIYDSARLVHLIAPDGKRNQVVVHAGAQNAPQPGQFPQPAAPGADPTGTPPDISEVYDLGVGKFEVTISTGPSFQDERQATEAWLLELFKVLPGLAQIGVDIVLENSDNPAAQQLAKRAKMMLPPQVQDQSDPDTAIPRLTAQNAQLQDIVQKAHALIQSLIQKVEGKQLDAQTKIAVAIIQTQGAMALAASKSQAAGASEIFQAEYGRLSQMVDHLAALAQQDADHQHALEQGQQTGAQASMAQDSAHQQTMAQDANAAALAPPPQQEAA